MVGATKLQGRYRLDDRIASGGMGAVWRATDERLDRSVAIKLLKPELAHDPRFVERFRREARAVAALAHPNIANVFDYGEDDERHYIVMELVEGRDLARVLREEGPLGAERAAPIAAQACEALGHAHAAGVVHRDVKPANIIVGGGDRVKVTDFGIARAGADSTLTAAGSVLGTAQYISPEQAAGEKVGPASDLYSLGIVLFEMLTGTLPFTGDSPIAIAMRHVSDEVPAPSSVNPEVGPQMDALVARATAKDPEQRFRDAPEMAGALTNGAGPGGRTAVLGAGAAAATERMAGPGSTAPMGPRTATAPVAGGGTRAARPVPRQRRDLRRVARGAMIALLLLVLVALALAAWRALSGVQEPGTAGDNQQQQQPQQERQQPAEQPPAEETVPVPEVIGSNYEDAAAVLQDAGLVPSRSDVATAESPPEMVIDANPAPGTEVTEGSTVTLSVAVAPPEEPEDGEEDSGQGGGPDKVPPGQEKKEDKEGKG